MLSDFHIANSYTEHLLGIGDELVMELLNERTETRTIVKRWDMYASCSDREEILQQLKKLDLETATAKDVAQIVGNGSWVKTRYECHECGQEYDQVVTLGEPPDYEACTADICEDCLRKALKLIVG